MKAQKFRSIVKSSKTRVITQTLVQHLSLILCLSGSWVYSAFKTFTHFLYETIIQVEMQKVLNDIQPNENETGVVTLPSTMENLPSLPGYLIKENLRLCLRFCVGEEEESDS
uniref:Uncharacterized protein n=1 Tax=Glossina austeni TaxID=7395 RepID=A0A1A9UZH1_GLOAU